MRQTVLKFSGSQSFANDKDKKKNVCLPSFLNSIYDFFFGSDYRCFNQKNVNNGSFCCSWSPGDDAQRTHRHADKQSLDNQNKSKWENLFASSTSIFTSGIQHLTPPYMSEEYPEGHLCRPAVIQNPEQECHVLTLQGKQYGVCMPSAWERARFCHALLSRIKPERQFINTTFM